MTVERYIEEVLQPKLQGDGGWIEYVSLEEGILTVIFRGECSKCLILHRCCDWICQQIKKDLDETVEIRAIRKKPYFQDT